MFDWLVETFTAYPYFGVAAVFLICGIGLPLPEEIVLITAGYVCHKGLADLTPMVTACVVSILVGDLIPFLLGRTLGPRVLRLRPLRILVSKRRLSRFDEWFRRRGDLVIFFARFLTGVRMVAYFTAGTMKMPLVRFLALDLIGIAVIVPLMIAIGYSSGHLIDEAIAKVQTVERGILITIGAAGVVVGLWFLLRRRDRGGGSGPRDTFVGPSKDGAPDEPERPTEDANASQQ